MVKKQITYLTPKDYLNRVIEADCLEIMKQPNIVETSSL